MTKEKIKEKETQQKYLQFQLLQQQIEQISQQLEFLARQFVDLESSQDALRQLQKTAKNSETLAAIAPGIFIKTSLKDNQKLIVNVGANTAAEKTVPGVIEMLEKQKGGLEKNIAQSDALLQALTQQALKIYQELETSEEKSEENVQQTKK